MKKLTIAVLGFMFLGCSLFSQIKIGYTNVELILAYMPESKAVSQQIATLEEKLMQQGEAKRKYFQTKYDELLELDEKNQLAPDQKELAMKELEKLQKELQDFASTSEEKLMAKREELLVPVLEKLQSSIDATAKENGYTYILNQTNSSGVSTILYGPEENDITELIFKKLGIQIPEGQ